MRVVLMVHPGTIMAGTVADAPQGNKAMNNEAGMPAERAAKSIGKSITHEKGLTMSPFSVRKYY